MRVLFCIIPALLVFVAALLAGGLIVQAPIKHALAVAGIFAIAMFGLGWQVTCPKRERLRDEEYKR